MLLQLVGVDVQAVDDGALAAAAGLPAGGGPGFFGQVGGLDIFGHFHRLHHLTDEAVAHDQHGIAVLVGQVEGLLGQLHGLLHGGGGQHQHAVVAVSAAAGGLIVVALGRLNGAQAGAAAHHVDDDAGQLGAHDIADALLLEGNAGAGGGGHAARTRARRAVHHVDGCDLAFRLEEAAALDFRQPLGHIFGNLVLGRNGVAEEEPASGLDGGLSDGLIALHEHFLTHGAESSLCLLFDGNDRVGAHPGAKRAADALGLVGDINGVIAAAVNHVAQGQQPLGAHIGAQAAALAGFLCNGQLCHPAASFLNRYCLIIGIFRASVNKRTQEIPHDPRPCRPYYGGRFRAA